MNKIIERKLTPSMTPSGEVEALRAEIDAIRAEYAIEIAGLHDRLEFHRATARPSHEHRNCNEEKADPSEVRFSLGIN